MSEEEAVKNDLHFSSLFFYVGVFTSSMVVRCNDMYWNNQHQYKAV